MGAALGAPDGPGAELAATPSVGAGVALEFMSPGAATATPPMTMAELLTRMTANVRKFDPAKVRPQDLAIVAAVAPEEG